MEKKHSLALSFILGGVAGGLLAVIFAPLLIKTRKAMLNGADTVGEKLRQMRTKTSYEGVYCAEEGVYCNTMEDTDQGFEELVSAD